MTDAIDTNSNNTDDNPPLHVATSGAPRKLIVRGAKPAWGFTGEIEIEHSQNNGMLKILTLGISSPE